MPDKIRVRFSCTSELIDTHGDAPPVTVEMDSVRLVHSYGTETTYVMQDDGKHFAFWDHSNPETRGWIVGGMYDNQEYGPFDQVDVLP